MQLIAPSIPLNIYHKSGKVCPFCCNLRIIQKSIKMLCCTVERLFQRQDFAKYPKLSMEQIDKDELDISFSFHFISYIFI